MSEMKFCQGPECHTYYTQDRLRGPKGNKTNQTRRRSSFYYLSGNVCSTRCQDDWCQKFGDKAIDHFGRLTEPKHLTEDNAWLKTMDWNSNHDMIYVYLNTITRETRPLPKNNTMIQVTQLIQENNL